MYKETTIRLVATILAEAKKNRRLTGFTIGNTAKIDDRGLFFTPLRMTSLMVSAGVIVYSEEQAVEIASIVDGHVDYLMVDVEKKIPGRGESSRFANVEVAVRKCAHRSTLWFYKANDLSVDAVDSLLAQLTKKHCTGLGGKKIAVLGAGNIGFKLALRLVERGARVVVTRRKKPVLDVLVRAINLVKPAYTEAFIEGTTSNDRAARDAEVLIGASSGQPLITRRMINRLADTAIIIDVGKGVLFPEAIEAARNRNIPVYRLDVTGAFEGLVHRLWAVEDLVEKRLGRRQWHGEFIISGGLLGAKEDVVVDNVHAPSVIYGFANGQGDFIRNLTPSQKKRLARLKHAAARRRTADL